MSTALQSIRRIEPKTNHRTYSSSGFTLVEMLIVLAIVAAVSALAMPVLFRQTANGALLATAQNIKSAMRLARAEAIRGNSASTVTIDVAGKAYWVDGHTNVSPIDPAISVEMTTLRSQQLSAGRGRMQFHSDGSATGGNVILRVGGNTVTIEVDWMSGHASLRRTP